LDKKIAFITYETPFAPGGGIAAVMAHLPKALQVVSSIPTYVVSPFHRNVGRTMDAESEMETIATIQINFDSEIFNIDLLLIHQDVSWVFIKPYLISTKDPIFFAGKRHPYDESPNILLRDSLFFGKAVAAALPIIDPDSTWTILMQDWEAATASLALSGLSEEDFIFSSYLTLHNSYDVGIEDDDLIKIGVDPTTCPGDTVLQCSLPLIKDPVFTVSEQFALDLSTEILQSEIMIPHIVSELTPRLRGANNGVFTNLTVPDKVLKAGRNENYTPIRNWKDLNRENAFQAMDNIISSEETPIWGDLTKFVRDNAPWFIMAGRDDSRQKGYELACSAISDFLRDDGQARFLFFPIPGDEGLDGINFIQYLTNRYPENVLGFPFQFREGYFAVMKGASYGLMPSYYEPFGMANEFYLNGVVCIGRATGGLLQQIIPNRDQPSFSPSVKSRAERWYKSTTPPTGFLFRENDEISSVIDDWIAINAAEYKLYPQIPDRLQQRSGLDLFQAMESELLSCLEDATNIYSSQPNLYYRLIINGISHITNNFSWNRTARIYSECIQEGSFD
jgi:glycogen synthase